MDSEPCPLNVDELRLWRAVIHLTIALPRVLDEDLRRRADISLTEYGVLARLSECPGRAARMSEIAAGSLLSPSRITRMIDDLIDQGLVCRERADKDGRGSVAVLTDAGLRRLEQAYPVHLAGVRSRVLDHLDPAGIPQMADALSVVVASLCPSLSAELLSAGPASAS